ncbi:hypothetical protein [Bordetella genomosp. 2]|nr:hypothetical protein [Bordetella genomosp. 2]
MSAVPHVVAQMAAREVCSAANALEAHQCFERSIDELADWQIIFADMSDVGSIKLLNLPLGESGFIGSVFRGRSLWIMDAPFVAQGKSASVPIRSGSAVFIDSNAASYIRAIAYQANVSQRAREGADWINKLGERLGHLNFTLYLWESQRNWTEATIKSCTQTIAAVHALNATGGPLTVEWGQRYRNRFRDQAEFMATAILDDFQQDLDSGLAQGINQQVNMMEAMLVRTQLLVLGSRKSPQHKLAELITFMHEALSTIALRELIVCGDILARNTQARIVHKLNSLQNHPDPLALLRNCAWDLYIPRALDQLCAVNPHKEPNFDFYLAELLTFDGDVVDMLRTTQLRALAVHRPTMQSFPFFDHDIAEWLGNRVGGKRMDSLEDIFSPKAFELRAQRRSVSTVEDVLNEDKNRLLHMLNRQSR